MSSLKEDLMAVQYEVRLAYYYFKVSYTGTQKDTDYRMSKIEGVLSTLLSNHEGDPLAHRVGKRIKATIRWIRDPACPKRDAMSWLAEDYLHLDDDIRHK